MLDASVTVCFRRLSLLWERGWFYLAILGAFAWGWWQPGAGQWMKTVGVTPYLVAFAFLLNGLSLTPAALLGSLRKWPLLVVSLLLAFVLPPALVLLARHWLPGGDAPLAAGFQLLSVMPTTLVSAVILTQLAGGNGALAFLLTVVANLAAIAVVPTVMRVTLGAAGAQLDLPGAILSLVVTVLLPTLAGQVIRWRTGDRVDRHRRPLGVVSQLSILVFITLGMASLPRGEISAAVWQYVILGSLLLHLLLLGLADGAGRLLQAEPADRRALIFATAQKTLVLAIFLSERLLLPLGARYAIAVLPAITYYVIELALGSLLAQWWGHTAVARSRRCPIVET